jgi:hypothetical protein
VMKRMYHSRRYDQLTDYGTHLSPFVPGTETAVFRNRNR